MERIELSKRSKNILFALKASQYPASIPTEDVNDIIVLIEEGLIKATPLINNQYCLTFNSYNYGLFICDLCSYLVMRRHL